MEMGKAGYLNNISLMSHIPSLDLAPHYVDGSPQQSLVDFERAMAVTRVILDTVCSVRPVLAARGSTLGCTSGKRWLEGLTGRKTMVNGR